MHLPDQAWNPHPLRWKCGVLSTGPPGKSQKVPSWSRFHHCISFLDKPQPPFHQFLLQLWRRLTYIMWRTETDLPWRMSHPRRKSQAFLSCSNTCGSQADHSRHHFHSIRVQLWLSLCNCNNCVWARQAGGRGSLFLLLHQLRGNMSGCFKHFCHYVRFFFLPHYPL